MRIVRILLVVIGVVLLAAAAAWRPVAVPRLSKLPTSLNQSIKLTGTYTSYVDQATGAPLPVPQQVPFTMDRTVKAVPGDSTSSVLVVSDTSAVSAGPVKSVVVSQYALDRSTSKSVKSRHAYAMTPGNVVDRTGTYSLGPPPGTDTAKSYPLYVDNIGRAVPETSQHTTSTVDGLKVQGWQQNLAPTPVTPAIAAAMKLPPSMPFASFAAQAKAQGTDLTAAFKALMPVLKPAERASLASATTASIPLQYLYSMQNKVLVEPTTGATVDIVSGVESFSVKPDLSRLAVALTPILTAHATNPVAGKLIASAGKLTGLQASPLYTISGHQDPASVASVASLTKTNMTLLQVLKLWIPVGLGVLGLIAIILGLVIRRRRPKKAKAEAAAPVTDAPATTAEATTAEAPTADAPTEEATAEKAAEETATEAATADEAETSEEPKEQPVT